MDMMQHFKERIHDIRKRINDNEMQRDRDNSGLEKMIIEYSSRIEALKLKLNTPQSTIAPEPVQQISKADKLKQSLMPKPKQMFVTPNTRKQKWPKKIVGSYNSKAAKLIK